MPEQSLIYLIHSRIDSLSEKEKIVAEYILANPASAVHPSIEELASRIGVSVSTLMRFVMKLGFDGYQRFRIALATETVAPESRFYDASIADSEKTVETVFSFARKALDMTEKHLDREILSRTAREICGASSFYLFGLGGSCVVSLDAFHKLIRLGLRCLTSQDFHIQLMLASQSGPDDFALLVSNTGANKDTLAIADVLRNNGCRFAAITTYPRSALAREADYVLLSEAPGSAVISEAFSARIAQLAIVDALYVEAVELLSGGGLENVEKMRSAIAGRRM